LGKLFSPQRRGDAEGYFSQRGKGAKGNYLTAKGAESAKYFTSHLSRHFERASRICADRSVGKNPRQHRGHFFRTGIFSHEDHKGHEGIISLQKRKKYISQRRKDAKIN
jgi:hypothetical protein